MTRVDHFERVDGLPRFDYPSPDQNILLVAAAYAALGYEVRPDEGGGLTATTTNPDDSDLSAVSFRHDERGRLDKRTLYYTSAAMAKNGEMSRLEQSFWLDDTGNLLVDDIHLIDREGNPEFVRSLTRDMWQRLMNRMLPS